MKESQKVVEVLTFESMDEIFWCYHSNETFQEYFRMVESNLVTTDNEGAMESVCIKCAQFKENVWVFLPQGQSKLSIIMRCLYKVGVQKAGFVCGSLQHGPVFSPGSWEGQGTF